jgi:hypothetical protein
MLLYYWGKNLFPYTRGFLRARKVQGSPFARLSLLTAFVFMMIWASFWFTVKLPLSHIYIVFFPLVMLFSCHCWERFAGEERWRTAAKVFLMVALYFQAAFAFRVAPTDSMMLQREAIAKALQAKDYRLFGERRPGSFY